MMIQDDCTYIYIIKIMYVSIFMCYTFVLCVFLYSISQVRQ